MDEEESAESSEWRGWDFTGGCKYVKHGIEER